MTKRDLDVLLVALFSLVLVFLILIFPVDILRLVLGLPFVLFFPGYTMVAALFPKKTWLGGVERIALSFGLSVAVVPLLGLMLNYTPWGIRLYPIIATLTAFIITMCIIALVRRSRLPDEERFTFTPALALRQSLSVERGNTASAARTKRWEKALLALLVIAVVAAIGAIIYTISTPKVGDKFTEFYILGPEGKTDNYPRQVKPGDSAQVVVSIVNQEQQAMTYRLEVIIDGVRNMLIPDIVLSPEQKWEQKISLSPTKLGDNQKVEFLLYKNVEPEPYARLHMWLNVSR